MQQDPLDASIVRGGEEKMPTLRYYCRDRGNAQVRTGLEQVARELGIPFEIFELSRDGAYSEEIEREVYERDFKPRARVLNRRTGESVTTLRSHSGRYFVSTPGTVAVVRKGKVEWFVIGDQDVISFLNEVLAKRGCLLN